MGTSGARPHGAAVSGDANTKSDDGNCLRGMCGRSMVAGEGDSKMGVQIGASPDSGFDDPLGMLKDCHRRIEHFLHVICLVAERALGRSLTGEETSAVQSALRYFREGGIRHTADEEESLFPRLREDPDAGNLEELGALESDHHEANELHSFVDEIYSKWITAGRMAPQDEAQLVAATRRLKSLYEAHIQVEEKFVFPRASARLSQEIIQTIGREFRRRRT